MGKVLSSMVTRRIQGFNAENRAHKFLEKEKRPVAPKFEGNLRDMERTLESDPEFLNKLNTKDSVLDTRLKDVYVTSEDTFIKLATTPRPLPTEREINEYYEYGHLEPTNIPPGKCTLRQATEFITNHQTDSKHWTAQRIAEHYSMDETLVADILQHFKVLNVYIPDKEIGDKLLTSDSTFEQLEGQRKKIKD